MYVSKQAGQHCLSLASAHTPLLHERADRRFASTRKIKMVERGVGRTDAAPLGGNFLQYTAWEQPGATIHSIGRWRHVTVELVGVTQLTEVSSKVFVLECREGVLWLGQGLPRIRDPCSKPVRIIYFFIVAKFLCFSWRFGSCCVHVVISPVFFLQFCLPVPYMASF